MKAIIIRESKLDDLFKTFLAHLELEAIRRNTKNEACELCVELGVLNYSAHELLGKIKGPEQL